VGDETLYEILTEDLKMGRYTEDLDWEGVVY
jgi:hypothetical protein